MSQFGSDKQLVSWAGLSPANNESAGKKKSVSIYHMILTGEEFNPCDHESFMDPKPNANPSLTVEKALNFLKQSGIDISSIPVNL